MNERANLLDLSHKTILITGGLGAIGQVVVRKLREQGARVAVNDILPDAQAQGMLPWDDALVYFRGESADADSVNHMLDAIEARMGSLPNIVCCHAGMVNAYPVTEFPLDIFDQTMQTNMRAAFVLAQAISKRWIARQIRGLLLFTSSWVQDVPWPEITPYTMSKSAMKAMTRGFARELAPYGIRANAVVPGIVAVGLAKRQWDSDPQYRARAGKAIPLGEMQPPETVANGFLFLCSDMASYMTGSLLLIDGGCSLYPMD